MLAEIPARRQRATTTPILAHMRAPEFATDMVYGQTNADCDLRDLPYAKDSPNGCGQTPGNCERERAPTKSAAMPKHKTRQKCGWGCLNGW